MEIRFEGIICFVRTTKGSVDAVIPDGVGKEDPETGQRIDDHHATMKVDGEITDPSWTNDPPPYPDTFELTTGDPMSIGDISRSDRRPFLSDWSNLLWGLKRDFHPDFVIDPPAPTYTGALTHIAIGRGTLAAYEKGEATCTQLVVTTDGARITLPDGRAFTVDNNARIWISNVSKSKGTTRSGGPNHFILHYFLGKKSSKDAFRVPRHPHLREDAAGNIVPIPKSFFETLVADCSNSTYP
jgi:hypothetical protein